MVAPSSVGVDASGIIGFIDALEADPAIEPHGLIVQRNGHRIAQGYWTPHHQGRARLVYSLSKSFTGAALGLQIDEGRLGLDDLVSDHLPDLFDTAHPDARRLRIRHIASMATGHIDETLGPAIAADPANPVRGFLTLPAEHEPGTVFAYNQSPVLTLALILERLAGERLAEYLGPRLLDPLAITDFTWARFPPDVDMGFSGVFTDLDAIAKLGQLHLDRGRVGDRSIVSGAWIDTASSVHTNNPDGDTIDWRQGYGFQLWNSQHGYRGDGAFGQYMVVLPEHDTVVALFSNTDQMQRVLDHLWAHLLPALDGAGPGRDDEALALRLAELRLPTATERRSAEPQAEPFAQLPPQRFRPAPPTATSHRTITSAEINDGRVTIYEDNSRLDLPLSTVWSIEGNVAASAVVDGLTIAVDVAFLNTPHRLELVFRDGEVHSDWLRLPYFSGGITGQLAEIAVAPLSS